MSATSNSTLTKLRNYNLVLFQEYFGQINLYQDNWMDLVGKVSDVIHRDLPGPMQVELAGIHQLYANEVEKEMDYIIYSDFCPPMTIRELCGFDESNFKKWQFYTGWTGNQVLAVYIFKNLNKPIICQPTEN